MIFFTALLCSFIPFTKHFLPPPKLRYAVVLMFIFLFMFGVLGVQFFSGKLTDAYEARLLAESDVPFLSFNNLWTSCVKVFAIMTGDEWNRLMSVHYQVSGAIAIPYFVLLEALGPFVVINMFVAIILKALGQQTRELSDRMCLDSKAQSMAIDCIIKGERFSPARTALALAEGFLKGREKKTAKLAEKMKSRANHLKKTRKILAGKALGLIPTTNRIRMVLYKLQNHWM